MIKTGQQYWDEIQQETPVPTGDPVIDELLGGGIRAGLTHLLIAHRRIASALAHSLIMSYHLTFPQDEWQKVYWVEGYNKFDPYTFSRTLASRGINPTVGLNNIIIARSFQWNQMTELLSERLPNEMKSGGMLLATGITELFEVMSNKFMGTDSKPKRGFKLNRKVFQDMNKIIDGINTIRPLRPYIMLTAPLHSKSTKKAAGGNLLHHAANVILRIILEQGIYPGETKIHYFLDQHPFLRAQHQVVVIREQKYKRGLKPDPKNTRLDDFF